MLIDRFFPNLLYAICKQNNLEQYSIRVALSSSVRDYLLVSHAITGCDIVSAIGLHKIDIFKKNEATHETTVRAGEMFVLELCDTKRNMNVTRLTTSDSHICKC